MLYLEFIHFSTTNVCRILLSVKLGMDFLLNVTEYTVKRSLSEWTQNGTQNYTEQNMKLPVCASYNSSPLHC